MERIDKIINKSLAKKGLYKATNGALVCFYAKEWGKGRFEPISFANGILKVSASSSPAAAELQIQENDLIEYLNKKLGKPQVKRLRIVLNNWS
jgi:predicted nucleic acid-binding Zn ribbon protein